jgi:hypothetical protein
MISRRHVSAFAVVGLSLLAAVAGVSAGEVIRPTFDFTDMRVEVHWMASSADIRLEAQKYRVDLPSATFGSSRLYAGRHEGFSILGKRNGERVCLIFVRKPEHVDDDRTTAVGHELLHCLLGAYHR